MASDQDWLKKKAQVNEWPFHSDVPIIGPLIIRFLESWNNIATRWYVRHLLVQQNKFNAEIVERLRHQDLRLIEQDRDQTTLVRDVAELSTQVAEANRLLTTIEGRLNRLEAHLEGEQQESE